MIEAVSLVAGAVLLLVYVYRAGKRAGRREAASGVYVMFAIPRDDVDIDIPRRQDTRRRVS